MENDEKEVDNNGNAAHDFDRQTDRQTEVRSALFARKQNNDFTNSGTFLF